ncbi:MFS transporter [Streptomyces sp.]|uniref:MFS transporter n=1 Tax=Streptomyces sp. TaxID=1931 RepID=UPI002F419D63
MTGDRAGTRDAGRAAVPYGAPEDAAPAVRKNTRDHASHTVREDAPDDGAAGTDPAGSRVAAPDGAPGRSAPVSLARNRDYRLLWTAQMLSEFGFHVSVLAFPLLTLALTGSAAASGVVLSTMAAAQMLAGLPAGAVVDRLSRKAVMLGCEAAQAAAAASMVAALWWGSATVVHMVAVAAVFGVSAALFEPAESATLPNLMPEGQLPTAIAVNSARSSLGQLAGTAAGGFLFAVGRVMPFLTDTITHTAAFLTLVPLRVPPRPEPPKGPRAPFGRDITAGLRWVWGEPRIRVTMLCAGALNLFFGAFYIVLVVRAQAAGTSPGRIGVMVAMLGAGGVLGSLAAPALYRRLSPRTAVVLVFWSLTVLTPLTLLTPPGPPTGVLFAAMALFPPVANTAIVTEQLLRTPDGIRGRLTSVIGLTGGGAAAGGPALGGLLAATVPAGQAVLICAAGIAAVTLLTTANRTLRRLTPVPDGT